MLPRDRCHVGLTFSSIGDMTMEDSHVLNINVWRKQIADDFNYLQTWQELEGRIQAIIGLFVAITLFPLVEMASNRAMPLE